MTIGPATCNENQLTKAYKLGVRVLRFNFPHYTKEKVIESLKVIRAVEKKVKGTFQLLMDTEWPQVRTWVLTTPIIYEIGDKFRIVAKEQKRGDYDLLCDYPPLIKEAKVGSIIKIDGGLFDIKVVEKWSESLVVQALMSYTVGSRRPLNMPGMHYKLPTLGPKDFDDIAFVVKQKFNYIAMSFTRTGKDVQILRTFLQKHKGIQTKIVAKIENQEGIDNLQDIIDISDMVMVARGDLGSELPVETIPVHQMDIIKSCKIKHTPVIVATQMLESMISNPVPTRAEVSDIFYAVREGADYIMLSWETAIGKYPIECINVMNKVIAEAKKYT